MSVIKEVKGFIETPICTTEEGLKELNIGIATVQQWYNNSYLSFKIEELQELDNSHYVELKFLNTM